MKQKALESRAAAWVDALEARLSAAELGWPDPKTGLNVAGVLRNVLLTRALDALSEREVASRSAPISALRLVAYRAKRELDWQLGRRRQSALPEVLSFCRSENHIADALPVAQALHDRHGWRVLFVATERTVRRSLGAAGSPALSLYACAPWRLGRRRRAARWLAEVGGVLAELERAELPELARRARTLFVDNAAMLLRATDAMERILDRGSFRAVLAGNPNQPEGHLLAHLAQRRGLPVVAVQHGTIFPLHWARCRADWFFAWGEAGRRELEAAGFPSARILVTGSPRHDAPITRARGAVEGRDTVLVATSGPGDGIISVSEHRWFIERLYEAADRLSGVRWLVKLHPKDHVRYYEEVRPGGHPAVEVRPAERSRAGFEIFSYLEAARVLVTVSSSTALDAMAVGVPVIAVELPNRSWERSPLEYLRRGCARRVTEAVGLANAVSQAWRGEPEPVVDAAAAAYVRDQFANAGHAAQTVADRLVDIALDSRREPAA